MPSSSLVGKTIVVVGGSSGIGYGVAKQVLLAGAGRVIIGSSHIDKVKGAIARLQTDVSDQEIASRISGGYIDAKNSKSVKDFIQGVGEIDHLVWTSGDSLRLGFPNMDLDEQRGTCSLYLTTTCIQLFQSVQTYSTSASGVQLSQPSTQKWPRMGQSLSPSVREVSFAVRQSHERSSPGSMVVKPRPGWSIVAGITGAVDAFARGLAVDLAPVRVNVVAPGLVRTEVRIVN